MSSRLDRTRDWEKLAAESDYKVAEMARRCKISRRQLQRFFALHFGNTPKHCSDKWRAQAAAKEILRGDLVKAVAGDVKYKDPSSLTRLFKRVEGATPRNYPRKSGGDVPK